MRNIQGIIGLFLVSLLLLAACGPKPQYKTRKGKKKLKYYNSIQYDSGKQPKQFKKVKNH